jgi:AraC-like DNA-binding protein
MHSWLHCNGQLVRHLVNANGIALDRPTAGVAGAHFEHYLSSIHFECSHGGAPDTRIVENVLRNLLYDIVRSPGHSGRARSAPPELLAARQFIEANYARRLTLPDLAAQANLSPPHFCTQFRRAFGVAPISYLVNYRMAQAAYLLLDRNLRVGEVARRVGIDDVYYFSRLFKQRFGKSPRAMRSAGMARG